MGCLHNRFSQPSSHKSAKQIDQSRWHRKLPVSELVFCIFVSVFVFCFSYLCFHILFTQPPGLPCRLNKLSRELMAESICATKHFLRGHCPLVMQCTIQFTLLVVHGVQYIKLYSIQSSYSHTWAPLAVHSAHTPIFSSSKIHFSPLPPCLWFPRLSKLPQPPTWTNYALPFLHSFLVCHFTIHYVKHFLKVF